MLESPQGSASGESSFCQRLGSMESCGYVQLSLEPAEDDLEWGEKQLPKVDFNPKIKIAKHFKEAVRDACMAACNGGLKGYPVRRIRITVQQISRTEESRGQGDMDELLRTDLPAVYKATQAAFANALEASETLVLEPLMKIEISVPNQHLGAVISLLGTCEAKIDDVSDRHGLKQVLAFGAMKSLFSFATRLRSVTQGRGEMSIQFTSFVHHETYFG